MQIAPSLLSADFARLGAQIQAVERGGADLLHLDVMDGHFVPNLTMGPPIVKSVRRVTKLPLDVHLMVAEPDRYLDAFAEAGATMMSVHVEATVHLHRTIAAIKALGCRAGVVFNPATPVVALEEIAGDVDYVLVMSVNPGFGGQAFIPRSESKVRAVRMLLDAPGQQRRHRDRRRHRHAHGRARRRCRRAHPRRGRGDLHAPRSGSRHARAAGRGERRG